MTEKIDWKHFRDSVGQGHDRIERVENYVGLGTPDLNYCIDGVEGWVEMKSAVEPARSRSRLLKHKLSQDQKNWMLRQRNAKGNCYIFIMTNKRAMLIDGVHADGINEMTVAQLRAIALWCVNRPIYKESWMVLRAILQKGK